MNYAEALKVIDTQYGPVLEAACFINKADCPNGLSLAEHGCNRMKAVRILNATIEARRA
jgi:hypothetical protein